MGYYLVEILKHRGAIVTIKKANVILKRPINKLFPTEYTYRDSYQTDQAREQSFRREATVIGELKRKYDCVKHWKGRGVFQHCKYQCFSYI